MKLLPALESDNLNDKIIYLILCCYENEAEEYFVAVIYMFLIDKYGNIIKGF